MKMSSLQVSTPEGNSGRLFSDAEDFTFRYHEDASPPMAISLSMPVRHDEFLRRAGISGVQPKSLVPQRQEIALARVTSKTSDLIIKSGRDEFRQDKGDRFI
jgi:hypothetical protein